MRVDALFSDYDGTLAREDVPREDSAIPPELDGALRRVAKDVAVAIVTSKDYEFIRPRTSFARAWGCVSGLEVVTEGAARLTSAPSVDLETMISETRGLLTGAQLEEKRSSRGLLLGFCIDWRGGSQADGS